MLTSCMQEGLSWVPEAVLDVEKVCMMRGMGVGEMGSNTHIIT